MLVPAVRIDTVEKLLCAEEGLLQRVSSPLRFGYCKLTVILELHEEQLSIVVRSPVEGLLEVGQLIGRKGLHAVSQSFTLEELAT